MNDAVMVGGLALFGSMGFIVVVAVAASALLHYLDPRIDHGEESH